MSVALLIMTPTPINSYRVSETARQGLRAKLPTVLLNQAVFGVSNSVRLARDLVLPLVVKEYLALISSAIGAIQKLISLETISDLEASQYHRVIFDAKRAVQEHHETPETEILMKYAPDFDKCFEKIS